MRAGSRGERQPDGQRLGELARRRHAGNDTGDGQPGPWALPSAQEAGLFAQLGGVLAGGHVLAHLLVPQPRLELRRLHCRVHGLAALQAGQVPAPDGLAGHAQDHPGEELRAPDAPAGAQRPRAPAPPAGEGARARPGSEGQAQDAVVPDRGHPGHGPSAAGQAGRQPQSLHSHRHDAHLEEAFQGQPESERVPSWYNSPFHQGYLSI